MTKTELAQEAMRERNTQYKRKERLRKQLGKIAGASVRVEVIPNGVDIPKDIKDVLGRLQEALKALDGLTPEQIHDKVTALTQVLHIKLQLQVNTCLDQLSSPDPDVRKDALTIVETLMPFITQITELNVKMQVVLGLNEAKGKLLPRRQPVALLPTTGNAWESQFGDTLTNKTIQ